MFELDNPFLPGLVTLAVIFLGIAIATRNRAAAEPVPAKHVAVSVFGVAAVLLAGLAAVVFIT